MYKLKQKYTDYNGVERNEEFCFNLNEAELTEMSVSEEGGLDKKLVAIFKEENQKEIIRIVKKIVIQAYGIKSIDGKVFRKSDAIREEFENSAAYPAIFMRLARDDKELAAFINNIIPQINESDKRKAIESMDVDDDIKKELLEK